MKTKTETKTTVGHLLCCKLPRDDRQTFAVLLQQFLINLPLRYKWEGEVTVNHDDTLLTIIKVAEQPVKVGGKPIKTA